MVSLKNRKYSKPQQVAPARDARLPGEGGADAGGADAGELRRAESAERVRRYRKRFQLCGLGKKHLVVY